MNDLVAKCMLHRTHSKFAYNAFKKPYAWSRFTWILYNSSLKYDQSVTQVLNMIAPWYFIPAERHRYISLHEGFLEKRIRTVFLALKFTKYSSAISSQTWNSFWSPLMGGDCSSQLATKMTSDIIRLWISSSMYTLKESGISHHLAWQYL